MELLKTAAPLMANKNVKMSNFNNFKFKLDSVVKENILVYIWVPMDYVNGCFGA